MQKTTPSCDDCKFLVGHQCKMWEVKIKNPHNSHCEIITGDHGQYISYEEVIEE